MAFFGGGSKYFEQVRNHSKIAFSVMFCCSAAGDMLPPMVVYKSGTGTVYQNWTEGGMPGSTYGATKSGWFDMDMFNRWFSQVRYQYGCHTYRYGILLLKFGKFHHSCLISSHQ